MLLVGSGSGGPRAVADSICDSRSLCPDPVVRGGGCGPVGCRRRVRRARAAPSYALAARSRASRSVVITDYPSCSDLRIRPRGITLRSKSNRSRRAPHHPRPPCDGPCPAARPPARQNVTKRKPYARNRTNVYVMRRDAIGRGPKMSAVGTVPGRPTAYVEVGALYLEV